MHGTEIKVVSLKDRIYLTAAFEASKQEEDRAE